MVKYIRQVYILIILIGLGAGCTSKIKNSTTNSEPMLSFEDFEDITENHPERYIVAPDSFLSHARLSPSSAEEKEIYAYGLLYMAYSLREHGHIYKSIQFYEKALNFIKANPIEDFDIDLYIIKPLANNYIRIDDNQKAIPLLEEILDNIPLNKPDSRAGYLNNLANAYIYNGAPEKAAQIIQNEIQGFHISIDKALLYNTLAQAYIQQGDTLASRTYNQKAITEFEKNTINEDTVLWYGAALTQNAELRKDTAAALKAIALIDHHFPHTQSRNKANIHLSLANMYFDQNQFETARKYYHNAFQYFKTNSNKYIWDYKYTYALLGLARCYSRADQLDSAFYYYEWAIENDFRTQQLITSEEDQLRNNVWNRNSLEELLDLYERTNSHQNKNITATILWCIELSKARLLINEINRSEKWSSASAEVKSAIQQIRQLYQRLDATESAKDKKAIYSQIKELTKEFQLAENYFEKLNFNPSKEEFLKRFFVKKENYYSYYIHQDSTLSVLYTNSKGIHHHKIKDKDILQEIRAFKRLYFSDSPDAYNNHPDAYIAEARKLTKLLLPDLVKDHPNVFLSLDGILYGLPFDALYKESFLVNDFNFAYLNSFLLFDFIPNKDANYSAEISLLYRAEFPKPLPSLSFVKQEVHNLTKHFKTLTIPPTQQNDSTIREAFGRKNIIHIAAHTILDSVENPYLYLHQAISTNQLRFFDIRTPLVFLSACNTGSGKPLPSEGTESIQRVFLSKNVPSVISTYWFANDETMITLTANFYEQLAQTDSPMEALAQAKRTYLLQASSHQLNPWYWANINYTGINNKVGLSKSSNLPFVIMGLIIILVVIVAYRRRL